MLAAVVCAAVACSCGRQSGQKVGGMDVAADTLNVEYAKGFRISRSDDGMRLLDIRDPEGREAQVFRFALVEKGSDVPVPEGYTRLEIPISTAICMTSLQLSNFIKLGLTEMVSGITSTRHLHNATMKRQLADGTTHKIGIEGNFDHEVIIALDPDVIFISPFKRGGYEAIRNVNIPLMPHLGYKELSPLGQAEWIKVVGVLTGHEKEAVAAFDSIAARYNRLRALAAGAKEKPVIFSGEMQGGHWYAVGGRSFLANIFRDAGGAYFLDDNEASGGVTIDFERVYEQASEAPYWRIVNSFDGDFSYDALADKDGRYKDFRAFKDHGVIYCNMKKTPFYETMPVEPDEVLADFIAVFHPELLPGRKGKYYNLLK